MSRSPFYLHPRGNFFPVRVFIKGKVLLGSGV
jgi:hypothetical protein